MSRLDFGSQENELENRKMCICTTLALEVVSGKNEACMK